MPLPLLAIAGIAAAGAGAGALIAEHNDEEWWKGALIGGTLGAGGAIAAPALAGALGPLAAGLGRIATGAAGALGMTGQAAGPAAGLTGLAAPSGAVGAGLGPAGMAAPVGAGVGPAGMAAPVGAGVGGGIEATMSATQLGRVLTPEEAAQDAATVAHEKERDAAQAAAEAEVTPDQEDGWLTEENRKRMFDVLDNALRAKAELEGEKARAQVTAPYQVFPPYYPVGGPGIQGMGTLPITQRLIPGPLTF